MNSKNAQQEMVGFILIVVLVVVALMVFLVISITKPLVSVESKSTESLLSSMLSYTTDCVISEPYRLTVRELVGACYDNKKCVNMNKMSCDYLNTTLISIMKDLSAADNSIGSYQLVGFWESDEGERADIFKIESGLCISGSGAKLRGEIESIYMNGGKIKMSLEVCSESDN